MKSIEELRAKTIPLPCAFAGEAGAGEVADFPMPGTDADSYTSYQSGFPVKFATDPSTASGGHILSKDMNKVGELATAELHFKESGLSHKFRTPGYIVTASISVPENTGWDKMIDKTAIIFDVYKTGTAYSIGDCFQWTKEKDSLPYVFYKVTTAITATDNTGWDAMDGKVVEISDRYSAGVEYNVGAVFLCEFRYPFQCLFGHFDGKYIKHIESQSRDNAVNFTANPLCIDNYVAETAGGEKKVFWKTVDKIYGLDEDLFRLEVDYSRVDKLQPTDTLKEDSLIVIGDYGYPGEGSVITPASASLTLTVGDQTIEFDNKGRCGIKIGNVGITEGDIVIDGSVPYPDEMCGYGNSTVVFYAKKGTAVSYKFNDGHADSDGTNVFAFPVILKVGKASGGIQ